MNLRIKTRLAQKVMIALGSSAYSQNIVQKEVTIGGLFNSFETPDTRGPYADTKKDGKYFIFAKFSGKVRNAPSVEQYYGATIDLDDTDLTPKTIKAKLKRYMFCLYSTFSHKIKGNRYRIVIPYKVPLNPTDHVDMVLYLQDMLGATGFDLSAKTLSLPAYLPAVNDTNKKHFVYMINHGLLINPMHDSIQARVPELRYQLYNKDIEVQSIDLNKEILAGERNGAIARIAGKFLGQGIAQDDLFDMVHAFNTKKVSPPLSDSEVNTIVKSIIKTHSRNHDDMAWGFDEIMRRMEDRHNVKTDFTHLCRIIAYGKLHKKFSVAEFDMLTTELKTKSGVTKKALNAEITSASYEIQGKDEELLEEAVQDQSETLKLKFKNWVYIASEDKLYKVDTGESLKREAFNAMFNSPDLKIGIFTLLTKYNIITKVSRVEFNPEEPEVFTRENIKYVNTYIPPVLEPVRGNIRPLKAHFAYLFPNIEDRKMVLDFFSYMIQNPGKKIRWMLIIKGRKGIGKTIIAEKILHAMLGLGNMGKVSNKLIQSDFNAWQLNRQLVVFEELNIGSNFKEKMLFTETLKAFITDDIITAHRKGVDPYDVYNKACCLGFTNADDPVVNTLDERRFGLFRTDAKPKEPRYYEEFAEYCDTHREAMYHYFMNRNIKRFKYSIAPDTKWGDELKASSIAWPGSVLMQLNAIGWGGYARYGCLSFGHLIDLVREHSVGKYKLLTEDIRNTGSAYFRLFIKQLGELGFYKLNIVGATDGRLYIKNRKQTVWVLPKNEHKCLAQEFSQKQLAKGLTELVIEPVEDWDEIDEE